MSGHTVEEAAERLARVRAHLALARKIAAEEVPGFPPSLDDARLRAGADALARFGDTHAALGRSFWDPVVYAYEGLGLLPAAERCRFRVDEAARGFLEARLTLLPTDAGGRRRPVLTGYRASWNLAGYQGAPDAGSALAGEFYDAPISLEDTDELAPGGVALVRLHPLSPSAWLGVPVGVELALQEGSRVLGAAQVVRVALRAPARAR